MVATTTYEFRSKEKAEAFRDKKNKRARLYGWAIRPRYERYVVYRYKKKLGR